MTVQLIIAPNGDELAVLPKAELDAMIEALENYMDNHAFDRAAARQAQGEEGFPDELIAKLIDGANPVRAFREHRGLSAADLAKRAKLSAAYLSQIESGAREGTSATLKKLAAALGVDVDLLLWS